MNKVFELQLLRHESRRVVDLVPVTAVNFEGLNIDYFLNSVLKIPSSPYCLAANMTALCISGAAPGGIPGLRLFGTYLVGASR